MSDLSSLASRSRRCVAPLSRRWQLLSIMGGIVVGLLAAGLAKAQSFPLVHELQTGQTDEFGVIHVEVDGEGALVFDVELNADRVGEKASIRRLFFNLLPETSDLWIESLDDEIPERLVVRPARRKLARSGARLDWRVDLLPPKKSRRGAPDSFQHVRFRIFADAPLTVEDLLPVSMTRDGDPVQMVVTMKRGRTPEGDRVRWVGGVYEMAEEPPILN